MFSFMNKSVHIAWAVRCLVCFSLLIVSSIGNIQPLHAQLGVLIDRKRVVYERDLGFSPSSVRDFVQVSCEAGVAEACQKLDRLDEIGPDDVLEYVENGCDQGHGRSCFALGRFWEDGFSRSPSYRRARRAYESSCETGFMPGCHQFASMAIERGKSIGSQELSFLSQACEQGIGASCSKYLHYYLISDFFNVSSDSGSNIDRERLIAMSARSCSQNNPYRFDCAAASIILHRAMIENKLEWTEAVLDNLGPGGIRYLGQKFTYVTSPANENRLSQLLMLKESGVELASMAAIREIIARGNYEYLPIIIGDNTFSISPSPEVFDGANPIIIAALFNRPQAVELFLSRGVDVNEPDLKGKTALLHAILAGHNETLEAIIEAGADVNVSNDELGSPLHTAVSLQNMPAINLLLDSGAFVDAITHDGETPLIAATMMENETAVRKILEYGANSNIRDVEGRTALFHAIQEGNEILANILLDHGADPTIANVHGVTPLALHQEKQREIARAEETAEQQRLARLEQQRREQSNEGRSNGLLGSLLGAAAGAIIGDEIGLDGGQIAEFASTMSSIGRAAETGRSEDNIAMQGSMNSLERRLGGGSRNAPSIDGLNERTRAAASGEGYQSVDHTFMCPTGEQKTVAIPFKSDRQRELRISLAETASCNRMEEAQAVMNQCRAEFGNPYCQ